MKSAKEINDSSQQVINVEARIEKIRHFVKRLDEGNNCTARITIELNDHGSKSTPIVEYLEQHEIRIILQRKLKEEELLLEKSRNELEEAIK